MPKAQSLPLTVIDEYLELDPLAKFGLRWKKNIYRQIKKGDEAGYLRPGRENKVGYAAVRLQRKVYYVHRIIYYLSTGKDPKNYLIDHIDGNTLNNEITNLRLATHNQNQRNRTTKNNNNTSGYKGVSWDKNRQKWIAQIRVNNKCIYLGRFSCKQKAAVAYNKAALHYFDEFAVLNTI